MRSITSSVRREMKESPEITSFWRAALPFALFIAGLGVLPHLLFSLNAGGLHYMANAWDEDTYTLFALNHHVLSYRLLGSWIFREAIALLGLDWGMIMLDGVAPFIAALIAAALCYRIGLRTRASMFLGGCLLLFALEFLVGCNLTMVGPLTQLLPFSSIILYPDWVHRLTPNVYENFFNLYKSPEPQITIIIQLAALYGLLRHAQTLQHRYVGLLAVLALSFPFIYVSTGIGLLLCVGLYAVVGLLLTNKRTYWLMLGCALVATAYYLYCFLGDSTSSYAGNVVFASRLPIISASILWGGALIWLYMKHWGQNLYTRAWLRDCPAPVMLALVCCAVPFITLNEQLITGQMVEARTWEGYGNLSYIALAMLLLWPLIETHVGPRVPHWLKRRAPYAATFLAVWLVLSQVANFAKHTRANMDNLITAELLLEQQASHPKGLPQVMLQASTEDAQVALRMQAPEMLFMAGALQTFVQPIALLAQGDAAYMQSQAGRDVAFAYFDRLGVTQEQFATNIDQAITEGRGKPEAARFFAYMDCWNQLSDFRNTNVTGMREKVPSIVADYGAFLKNKARRNQFGEVWFATRKPHAMRNDVPWKESVLATRTRGMFLPATVTIYKMTPR